MVFFLFMDGFSPCCAQGPAAREASVLTPCRYEGGGRFTAIAIDPKDSRTYLIGSDVAGVFKTVDDGENFLLKGRGLEGFSVADIAMHPSDANRVFLLSEEGLYESRDRGESWKRENSTVRYESRQFGSRLMVFFKGALWVATDKNGVYRIMTGLSPWTAIQTQGLERIKVNSLAVLGEALFAATGEGIFRWADSGRWQPAGDGLPAGRRDITDMAAHPENRMYLVEKTEGLYVWNEDRKKWEGRNLSLRQTMLDRPGAFKALAVHPRNPDTVLLATHPEVWPHLLYKTNDGGKTWRKVTSFQLAPEAAESFSKSLESIERIAFCPSDPRKVLLTDWLNVWRSRDEGENWVQLHKGLQNTVVNEVVVHPSNPREIYIAACDNGLVASVDGGGRWVRRMSGVLDGHANALAISPRDPSKMYLLMNPWNRKDRVFVYKTADGGKSWRDISFPVPPAPLPRLGYVDGRATSLVLDPVSDEVLYVGTNGYGIFKTMNGGNTWKAANYGIASPYLKGPKAVLIDPRNTQVLYASTQGGGIFKSTDGGGSWGAVSGHNTFTFGMAMDPGNPSRIFAACPEKKIILSEDAGKTWREILLPGERPARIAAFAIAVHPLNPNWVAVGTLAYEGAADGVYVSRDGGGTFSKLDFDLPAVSVLTLDAVRTPEFRFFIGFNGIGAFQCVIPGAGR